MKIPVFQRETFTGCQRVPLDDPAFKLLAAWYQKWEKRQLDGGDKGLIKTLADEILRTESFAKDAGGDSTPMWGACTSRWVADHFPPGQGPTRKEC